jgi:asparagine synthase (glutamine-hydrolysing)
VRADLAFARLAIVDPSSAGQQPMSSEDGRLTMVFNGENLQLRCASTRMRVRRSSMDGEVILHMWRH